MINRRTNSSLRTINMLSSADKVKGQGVGAAYEEHLKIMDAFLKHKYNVLINHARRADLHHIHTVDPHHFFKYFCRTKTLTSVHFIPETLDGSVKLPGFASRVFNAYVVYCYKRSDHLITVNRDFVERLRELGVPDGKIHYIPNHVSREQFHKLSPGRIQEIREQLGVGDRFCVFGVGQVQTRKGVKDFVEIAKRMPDISFIWAGGFSFGKITDGYKELKKIIEDPPENVRFTGIVDRNEMNDLYNAADLFFLPSFSELFPMSILEAMNTETPIMLRDLDLYHNILEGYYTAASDIDGFVELIREMQTSPDIFRQNVQRSIDGATYYSSQHISEMWERLYDDILD